jgi:hypothetical protein
VRIDHSRVRFILDNFAEFRVCGQNHRRLHDNPLASPLIDCHCGFVDSFHNVRSPGLRTKLRRLTTSSEKTWLNATRHTQPFAVDASECRQISGWRVLRIVG